jgi:hypothetical protein
LSIVDSGGIHILVVPADSGFRRNDGTTKRYQSGAAQTEVGNPAYLAPRRSSFSRQIRHSRRESAYRLSNINPYFFNSPKVLFFL